MAGELMLAITAHGYGHLAQLAPVVAELRRRRPDLALRVRSSLPADVLRWRLGEGLAIEAEADDFGMQMHSPFAVDVAASLARYRAWHADWEGRVARLAARLAADPPALILADVPYLTLAAAARAGIPSLALCSLNWADILRGYVDASEPEWAAILATIDAAYASARHFLQPAPSMPMRQLPNRLPIAPCIEPGQPRRQALRQRLGLSPDESLLLVAMGGFSHRPPLEQWPASLLGLPLRWLVPDEWGVAGEGFVPFSACGMAFSDLLASSDLLLTKPGYGSFAEAAANGIPLLYVDRGEWPEQPALVEWLGRHGRGSRLSREQFERGDFAVALRRMLASGRHTPVVADGAQAVVAQVEALLAEQGG